MVIRSANGCWNKMCADIAYCGATYGANSTYKAEESVPMLRRPGIVPHLKIIEPSIHFEPVSRHIPNCKPVHTDQNLNGFPLRSVLLRGYKYYYSKMTAHSSSTPHPQKHTSHSSAFPCVCHGQREFWVERLPPGRGEPGSGSTRDVPPRRESSQHVPPHGRSSREVPPRRRSSTEDPPRRRCSRLIRPCRGSRRDVPTCRESSRDVLPRRGGLGNCLAGRQGLLQAHACPRSPVDGSDLQVGEVAG